MGVKRGVIVGVAEMGSFGFRACYWKVLTHCN